MQPQLRVVRIVGGVFLPSLALLFSLFATSSAKAQTSAFWSAPVDGSWTDPTKWSTDPAYPNNSGPNTYDAIIDASGSPYSVTLAGMPITVQSVTVNSPDATIVQGNTASLAAGTLDIQHGAWHFAQTDPGTTAGVLSGAYVSSSTGLGELQVSSGSATFDNVTLAMPVTIGSGATLSMTGNWSNTGTFLGSNANLVLGGSFSTSQIGAIQMSNSTISLSGTIANASSTLTIDPTAGYWTVAPSATINSGTVSVLSGGTLHISGGTFSGVTFAGTFAVDPGASVSLTGTVISRPGTQFQLLGGSVGQPTRLNCAFSSTGDVSFDGLSEHSIVTAFSVIGTVRTGTAGGTINAPASSTGVGNSGLISAQTAGTTLTIDGMSAANFGTTEARNGATLQIIPYVNTDSSLYLGYIARGTWSVFAGSTMDSTVPIHAINGGKVTIDGANASFPALRALDSVSSGSLTVSGGAGLVTDGSLSNSKTITVGLGSSLGIHQTFTNTGTLNLSGSFTVDYAESDPSPLSSLVSQIRSGYTGGNWNGPGINSSTAAADPSKRLGYFDDTTDTSVLVQLTYGGDANLDGMVDQTDLGALASHWSNGTGYWADGDFNYDGRVDVGDLLILALNWQAGAAPGSSIPLDQAIAALGLPPVSIPEPAGSAGAIALAGLAMLRRRRLI